MAGICACVGVCTCLIVSAATAATACIGCAIGSHSPDVKYIPEKSTDEN